MDRSSFASSGVSPVSPGRRSRMTERFDVLPASKSTSSQTRLHHQRRRFSPRDSVSTAIAPNGWVAAAAPSQVHLYHIDIQDLEDDVKPNVSISLKSLSKGESVRAVAISNDLLAVVTHLRLLVYEYQEAGDIDNYMLPEVRVGQRSSWTPRSVSILQVESSDANQSAAAWVAVGGEGVNGVKLYQYTRNPCWTALRNCRLILKCPQNTGLVHSVGFSTFVRMNCFVVFAVTSENHIVCWYVRSQEIGSPELVTQTEYDTNATQSPSAHRGDITAVQIFESPSGVAYILVATNQRHGSRLRRSFLAPLGSPSSQWRSLPDSLAGRQFLSAAVAPNGRFVVVAEEGTLKLLTLRAAFEGGLTCSEQAVEWTSSLQATAKDLCAIALCIRERRSCLEITGVDGRGHVLSARASVPGMSATAPPSLTRWASEMAELHGDSIVPSVPELCGKEVGQAPRVVAAVRSGGQRLSGGLEEGLLGR